MKRNIEKTNLILEKKDKKDIFLNLEKSFSSLKNKEGISKEFYINQLKNFENKYGEQGKQILSNLQDFLKKNNLDNVKLQLATVLLVENIIEKKQNKAGKVIKFLENKKPALLLKMINGFNDNVLSNYKLEQKEDKLELKKNKKLEKKELYNEEISKLVQKINSQLEKKAPKLNNKIKTQALKLQKQYPQLSQDQAYLLTFDYFYQKDPNLRKEIKLDTQDLALISSVKEQFSNIKINSIVSEKQVQQEFTNFVDSKAYDNELSSKLEKAKFDIQTQKLLSEKYPNFIQTALDKIAQGV